MDELLQRFLDEEGKVKQLPSKKAPRQVVLQYLCEKFDPEQTYAEREVNVLLAQWHTFDDFFLLRREMVNEAWLMRLPNGSKYWVNKEKISLER